MLSGSFIVFPIGSEAGRTSTEIVFRSLLPFSFLSRQLIRFGSWLVRLGRLGREKNEIGFSFLLHRKMAFGGGLYRGSRDTLLGCGRSLFRASFFC